MIIGRVGFDEETRRKPQTFAAVGVVAGVLKLPFWGSLTGVRN